MNNLLVSIIIPVYNGSDFLQQAIESALAQSYKNIEILVINDGSTDRGKTKNLALSYGDKIKYLYKENGGVATALNYGIEKAQGEYISWLSHDDLYHPEKIEQSIKALKAQDIRESTIIFNDYELIDSNGKTIQKLQSPRNKGDIFFGLISNTFALNGCTLLIPKKAFLDIGLFEPSLLMTQDYNMWVRMMKGGYDFVNHPVCLTRYRIHENQGSIKKKSAFHKEIQQAQGYILNNFTPVEIQQKSNSSLHKNILYLYLKFIFFKQNRIGQITELTQKIGIYTILAPVYRKLFIK